MPRERAVLCGSVRERSLPFGDADPLHIRLWGPNANAAFKIEEMRRSLYKAVPSVFLDLIDIAIYVYCADQCTPRNGGGIKGFDEKWRRRFFFQVPVSNPDLWESNAVHDRLVATLSFLSEDEYHFEFERLREPRSLEGFIDFQETQYDDVVEEVMLFSGGLDSLSGAVQESCLDKRKVLLVNHRATEKMSRRHEALLSGLSRHTRDRQPLHLPIRIHRARN